MNPFLKTFVSQLAGMVGGGVLYAFDHPTGGFANTLVNSPTIAVAYVALSQLAHNLISKYAPTTPTPPIVVAPGDPRTRP
jgi:hypothetical protein